MTAKKERASWPMKDWEVRAILDGSKMQARRPVKTTASGRVKLPGHPNNWHLDDLDCVKACPYGKAGDRLAGQAHARDCGDGREAPRSEVYGCGTGAYPLGNQQGLVQPAARGACAGCGAVVDSGHRIGGDRLYVRETWAAPHAYDHLPPRLIPQDARIHYAATEDRGGLLWRPSIHMFRWASRITLEIVSVRVERLRDISEADALAEGVSRLPDPPSGQWSGQNRFTLRVDDVSFNAPTAKEVYAKLCKFNSPTHSINENPWVWVTEFKLI